MFKKIDLGKYNPNVIMIALAIVAFLSVSGCDKTKKLEEASGKMVFYNWADYTPPDLVKKFEAETGIQIITDYYDTNERLLTKLKAGGSQYDIVVPTHNFVKILIDEGLIQKVGVNTFPNFKNIDKKWRKPEWDPEQEYTVPWQFGSTSFAYLSDSTGDDFTGTTLKDFFEPNEQVCGKMSVFDSPDDVISLGLIYLGYNLCTTKPEELQAVQDLLIKQKKCVKVYSSETLNERLKTKEVLVSNNWDGNTFRGATELGISDAKYAYPEEGLLTWYDNVAVPTDAQNVPAAKVFMNFVLEPENMAIISNAQGYNNAIPDSREFLKKELAESPILQVPAKQKIVFAETCGAETVALFGKVWTQVRK